jgi:hypothetical protein
LTRLICFNASFSESIIEDPVVIRKILDHIGATPTADASPRPEPRAPPQAALFDQD